MTAPNGHRKRGRGVRALIPDLADGTNQGTERAPCLQCLEDADAMGKAIAASLVLAARLECAVTLLRQLERVITRTGGYMLPEDQDALRAARALLVDLGK